MPATQRPDYAGTQATGDTQAGGLGGALSDFLGGQAGYRAARGQYGRPESQRLARDREMQEASRGGEAQFTNYLMDAAQGRTGPSVAQQQLAQSTGRAQQQAASMAASARGPNRALAQRAAIQAGGQIQGEANAQAAVLRAQEQMSREQLVAEQLRQRRLMDLQQQGLTLDEANAKLQAEMQAQGINAQIAQANAAEGGKTGGAILSAVGGLLASDIRNKTGIVSASMDNVQGGQLVASAPPTGVTQEAYSASLQRANERALSTEGSADPRTLARRKELMDMGLSPLGAQQRAEKETSSGSGVNIGAIMGMLSDVRTKELTNENETLKEALRAATGAPPSKGSGVDLRPVHGYRFNYKNPNMPGADDGPQVGGMAHEIAASDAAPAVKNTKNGQMVDAGRLTMALAPAVGGEQRRGDVQDARIADLENALRGALRATGGDSYSNEPMELGLDTEAGIHRAIGSVPGETNEQRLARELEATLKRRRESPFNLPPPRYDEAGLDRASRSAGLEPRAGGMR